MNFPTRIKNVPPYLWAEMDKVVRQAKKTGVETINIATGDPDLTPPQQVIEELNRASQENGAHKYPTYWGMIELRERIAQWMKKRFNVMLDPEKEIMILIGAKEGIVHLSLALCSDGDYVLIPDPGYPAYQTSAIFADAMPIDMPLLEKNDYLPDLKIINKDILNKARVVILNYPNNPTSRRAVISFFKEAVQFCRKWGIHIIHDNAYSEIYEDEKPPSILEVDGSKEIATEIHSFSKTFNMQGFRIGWICGNSDIIRALSIIKTNTDSGIFVPIQKAAMKALDSYEDFTPLLREKYKKRRLIIHNLLNEIGWQFYPSDSTVYVWTKMNSKEKDSMKFVINLIKEKGVLIGPGSGYGKYGEGYLRFSLTQPEDKIEEGMRKFIEYLKEEG